MDPIPAFAPSALLPDGLPDDLEACVGKPFRFVVDGTEQATIGSRLLYGTILDAYTIGRRERNRPQKVQVKVSVKTCAELVVHSLTFENERGVWMICERRPDGLKNHAPLVAGTFLLLDRGTEPEVEHPIISGFIDRSGLPNPPGSVIGQRFRFFRGESREASHELIGHVTSLEVSTKMITLSVSAPAVFNLVIEELTWERLDKWKIGFKGPNGTVYNTGMIEFEGPHLRPA